MKWTPSLIKEKLAELESGPKKSLGQNFLVSEQAIDKITKKAIGFDCELIEIGPGLGALTEKLIEIHRPPVALIELDRHFVKKWSERGLRVISADALQIDWNQFAPLSEKVLVSNLPYQIAASLVIERSMDPQPLRGMVLMFQKEVAQKIKARHGDDSYGMLSVIAQEYWDIEMVLEASSKDFFPPPKVASRVLSFKSRNSEMVNRRSFLKFIKACFSQPRKLMVSNLSHQLHLDKQALSDILDSQSINTKARAEELTRIQFRELYKKVNSLCPS